MHFLLFNGLPLLGLVAATWFVILVKRKGPDGLEAMITSKLNDWYWLRVFIGVLFLAPIVARFHFVLTVDLDQVVQPYTTLLFASAAIIVLAVINYFFFKLTKEVMAEVENRRKTGDPRIVNPFKM